MTTWATATLSGLFRPFFSTPAAVDEGLEGVQGVQEGEPKEPTVIISADRRIINPRLPKLAAMGTDIVGYMTIPPGQPVALSWTTNGGYSIETTEDSPLLRRALDRFDRFTALVDADPARVYHAVLDPNGDAILTHVVQDGQVDLDFRLDPAATVKQAAILPCEPGAVCTLREAHRSHKTGILFILKSGGTVECWSHTYQVYRMWRRPANISIERYYVLLLNKHAIGDNFVDFYADVYYDTRTYLSYYPEDKAVMLEMGQRLEQFINQVHVEDRQTTLLAFINEDPELILGVLNRLKTNSS